MEDNTSYQFLILYIFSITAGKKENVQFWGRGGKEGIYIGRFGALNC